jgi:CRISPR/Cas system CSM-associated protein Csm2 small subunit
MVTETRFEIDICISNEEKEKSREETKNDAKRFFIYVHLLKYALGNGTSRSTSREKFYRIL